ncbi:MAG: YncE family protein [Chloroflexi bacterium]|nr:YncE family protein [Chloroflexota bacterium]
MPNQTILWTALPNGISRTGDRLQLSVFVSPRLVATPSDGRTLLPTPDLLAWPERMRNARFRLEFGGGPTVEATFNPAVLKPDLWRALFKQTTLVRSHRFDDFTDRKVISYPVRNLHQSIKQTYQDIGLEAPQGLPPHVPITWETDSIEFGPSAEVDGEKSTIAAVAADEQYVYATYYFDDNAHGAKHPGQLVVIDATTLEIVARVTVGKQPRSIAVDPLHQRIYVVNYHQEHYSLSAIDRQTFKIVPFRVDGVEKPELVLKQVPIAVVVSSKRNRIFVTNPTQKCIHVIDGATNTLQPQMQIALPQGAVGGIAIDDAADRLYVIAPNGDRQDVVEIEIADTTHHVVKSVTIDRNDSFPSEVALTEDHIYINNVTPSGIPSKYKVTVLNRQLEPVTTVLSVGQTNCLGVDAELNHVYAPDRFGIQVIDSRSQRVISRVPYPSTPRSVAAHPTTHQVFVGASATNRLFVATPTINADGQPLNPLYGSWDVAWNAAAQQSARNNLDRTDVTGRELTERVLLFHRRDPQEPEVELPEDEADFAEVVDFHEVVSTLGDYPALLRQLGLVIDLSVPIAAVPPGATFVRVLPTWPVTSGVVNSDISPKTACIWDGERFTARPAGDEIVDGMLALDEASYDLIQLDVDGAALKTNNLTNNLMRVDDGNAPLPRGLATLRSAGIALTRHGRAAELKQQFQRARQHNDSLTQNTTTLFAEDLVRGYRVDIWDDQTKRWHSLTRRVGSYTIADQPLPPIEDEGFVQTAVTESAAPATTPKDLYLHEALCRWEGWSVVARRPGKSINHSADPSQPPEDFDNAPVTPFKLKVDFAPVKGSLPRLRFGGNYRVRMRIADLAGNGPTLDEAPDLALPADNRTIAYLRYEPVEAPAVVLRSLITQEATPGESLERLVVRTANNDPAKDGSATATPAERHIAPPRSSQLLAETHRVLDNGTLKADLATYTMLRTKDDGQFKTQPVGSGKEPMPVEPAAQLALPYLPDPLSRGAAFRDLPGAPDGTVGTLTKQGTLVFTPLPDIKVRGGSAAQIGWGSADTWPELRPFRLVIQGGNQPPRWDAAARVLTVHLPPAESATVSLSSFLNEDDLKLMGVWQWLREAIDKQVAQTLKTVGPNDPYALDQLTAKLARVTQFALEGGHVMLTPPRDLVLVHAVQQPLGRPDWTTLSVQRSPQQPFAKLSGRLDVHAKSTDKVEIVAAWDEPIDRLDEPTPRVQSATTTVAEIPLAVLNERLDSGKQYRTIKVGGKPIARYYPATDQLEFAGSTALQHVFGDTRHRVVRYRSVSASRFREYFPPTVPGGFTRSSDPFAINVPSSTRPAAPRLQYVIPAYGWQRHTETNLLASRRRGHTLRVYLDRPWFSSGEGELLGVVVWPGALTDDLRERLKPYVTQVGADPTLIGDDVRLDKSSFQNYAAWDENLRLEGLAANERVNVAAYPVGYDAERQLWYSDITLNPALNRNQEAYGAFVRLALVRYQPNALPGTELSRAVLADFAQLAPDRSVVATYDLYDPGVIRLAVSGLSFNATASQNGQPQPDGTSVEVSVEMRRADMAGDLAWTLAPAHIASIVVDQTSEIETMLWRGRITLPAERQPGQFRIVIKEFESWLDDATAPAVAAGQVVPRPRRLVYADMLDL